MTRVLAVSAGLSSPSSTRLLTDRLADAVRARLGAGAEVDVVELRPLAHALADHLLTGFPNAELEAVLDQVREADALVMVTPVFSASFSGLFKTFVDVLEPGLLIGKPVLIGATAGTSRHSLVLDHALRPLFAYLRAVVVPTGVFAATEDFGDHGLEQRIERAAGELADLLGGRRSLHVVRDEFADPTPFADRLRGLST
ncbi:FMN reductase [Nocardioides sp. cx-173]|uniref:FMN reductase n=1 Tax=Nocardioides sp. cx-173 TaxID=2898796 RepID=UPI001E30D341|nr:FMN reductase [Nocardioides sp. cx-173]MCD4525805.1 FMN reductase [Nocardioides sp. cx-173]UGB39960.1 FMN reductase [Nocardioides sp. cx-173]